MSGEFVPLVIACDEGSDFRFGAILLELDVFKTRLKWRAFANITKRKPIRMVVLEATHLPKFWK